MPGTSAGTMLLNHFYFSVVFLGNLPSAHMPGRGALECMHRYLPRTDPKPIRAAATEQPGCRELTSKRQSPPMSLLLSKQVGSSPSSRQHFRAHRPEAPAPMMATLLAGMSPGVVVAAGVLDKLWPGVAEPGVSLKGGCPVLLGLGVTVPVLAVGG